MKPVNLSPVSGHVVKRAGNVNPLPQDESLVLIRPRTGQRFAVPAATIAQARSIAAHQQRAAIVPRSRDKT